MKADALIKIILIGKLCVFIAGCKIGCRNNSYFSQEVRSFDEIYRFWNPLESSTAPGDLSSVYIGDSKFCQLRKRWIELNKFPGVRPIFSTKRQTCSETCMLRMNPALEDIHCVKGWKVDSYVGWNRHPRSPLACKTAQEGNYNVTFDYRYFSASTVCDYDRVTRRPPEDYEKPLLTTDFVPKKYSKYVARVEGCFFESGERISFPIECIRHRDPTGCAFLAVCGNATFETKNISLSNQLRIISTQISQKADELKRCLINLENGNFSSQEILQFRMDSEELIEKKLEIMNVTKLFKKQEDITKLIKKHLKMKEFTIDVAYMYANDLINMFKEKHKRKRRELPGNMSLEECKTQLVIAVAHAALVQKNCEKALSRKCNCPKAETEEYQECEECKLSSEVIAAIVILALILLWENILFIILWKWGKLKLRS